MPPEKEGIMAMSSAATEGAQSAQELITRQLDAGVPLDRIREHQHDHSAWCSARPQRRTVLRSAMPTPTLPTR